MKLLINISDELYNYICSEQPYDKHLDKRFDFQIRDIVKKGTQLPKGHGRLIDADLFVWEHPLAFVRDVINDAPTIIEADMGGEK